MCVSLFFHNEHYATLSQCVSFFHNEYYATLSQRVSFFQMSIMLPSHNVCQFILS